jgi:hypothetical protein
MQHAEERSMDRWTLVAMTSPAGQTSLQIDYRDEANAVSSSRPIAISNLSCSTVIRMRSANLAEVELSTGEKLNVLIPSQEGAPILVSARSAERICSKQRRAERQAFWSRLIGRAQ